MDIELTEEQFKEQLEKLESKIKDAEENLGDIEVRDAILAKAFFYKDQKKKKDCIQIFELALSKTIGLSKKLEIEFEILEIYFKELNLPEMKIRIDRIKKLLEEAGDWERRNRLKVYEGMYDVMTRQFKQAAELLLDTIPTFNCPEVIAFKEVVFYTVIVSMVALPRSQIKSQVIHSPDILSTIRDIPHLKTFLDSFYLCDYKQFFLSFYQIIKRIEDDVYINKHKKYFIKEMRVVIYSQFLESYKTVTLQTIAQAFGVSVDFIDKELSELISARRLNCKVDKVSGYVEAERSDQRNALYQEALKQGDILLNRIQKLSRIIDI